MANRVFFPQSAVDRWMVDGTVDLQENELTILAEGRRYTIIDAIRVLREVSGATGAHELVGRVRARAALEQLGAEIVESSMLLGDAAFDIELGWLGVPTTTIAEHLAAESRGERTTDDPKTDEDLLTRFLTADH